jgi:oligoendopeptidase F
MAKKKKSGIKIKKSKQGSLRKIAGVKKGQKIPVSTLRRLKKSKSAATRKKANFALNARKFKKGGKK